MQGQRLVLQQLKSLNSEKQVFASEDKRLPLKQLLQLLLEVTLQLLTARSCQHRQRICNMLLPMLSAQVQCRCSLREFHAGAAAACCDNASRPAEYSSCPLAQQMYEGHAVSTVCRGPASR